MPGTDAHRHVTHRDGGEEGGPDAEADASPMKESQRDLTSLSGPVRRSRGTRIASEPAERHPPSP